jgi:PhnB protein
MAGPQRTIIPHLVIDGAVKALDFYARAFGAVEVRRMPTPDGRLMHAEFTIGESTLLMCDEFPEYANGKKRGPRALGAVSAIFHMNVPDCDQAIAKAAAAGAKIVMPASDQFWGDRYGVVEDPFGYQWSFAHPLKK